jgi:hypothetical protein
MSEAVMGTTITPLSQIASNFLNISSNIPAIDAIITSLPEKAIEKGVLSPKALENTLPKLLNSVKCQFMVNEEGNGVMARLRSAMNSRMTKWSEPKALEENAELTGEIDQASCLIVC